MATDVQTLRERREAIVREHVAAENRRDVEATILRQVGILPSDSLRRPPGTDAVYA